MRFRLGHPDQIIVPWRGEAARKTEPQPPPQKPGFFRRAGRWFSWRRKRFWLLTLPFGFAFGAVAALFILMAIPNVKSREFKIGSWQFGRLNAMDHPAMQNSNMDPPSPLRTRSLSIGSVCILLMRYSEPGTIDSSQRGFVFNRPLNGRSVSFGAEHWLGGVEFFWE